MDKALHPLAMLPPIPDRPPGDLAVGHTDETGAGAHGGAPLPVKMYFHPLGSPMGAASMLAILAATRWVEGMRATQAAGLPWLGLLTVAYLPAARGGSSRVIMEK